ncbi:AAA family ATPase [Desulfogranum japonicum]|uniref:AAA family ATPase n=1 Tax=Desulfogranum japonicum TaxID=231447 RepID=UPI00040822E3|nr:AAA family ATPase [Desulfogranum japonicum]
MTKDTDMTQKPESPDAECENSGEKQAIASPEVSWDDNSSGTTGISETLFGRSEQVQTILRAWERTGQAKQIIHIQGPSGIGKSALVQSVGKYLGRKRCRYICGKFDQTCHSLPYSALSSALNSGVEWILSQDGPTFDSWKSKITRALKNDASLITQIVPNLKYIIPSQEPSTFLSPIAEKNRFEYLFQIFIRAFTDPDQPLLVFVDDLQWADDASMDLIRLICLDDDLSHILFVVAFREKEMLPEHPWFTLLEELARRNMPVEQLTVPPLKRRHIQQQLCYLLQCPLEKVYELSKVVANKTGGIPILIEGFVLFVQKQSLLTYNSTSAQWEWNAADLGRLPVCDNAALFISARIAELDKQYLDILVTAALLGYRFEVVQLLCCCEMEPCIIEHALSSAEKIGLLVTEIREDRNAPARTTAAAVAYSFAHDCIQDSLLTTLTQQEYEAKAVRIGRVLQAHLDEENSANALFQVINLLNVAPCGAHHVQDLFKLVLLNHKGGVLALTRAAYVTAFTYFSKGIECVEFLMQTIPGKPSSWAVYPELTQELYQGAAQAALLLGKSQEMDALVTCVDEQIDDPLSKTKIYEIKTSFLYASGKMDEAIDVALDFARQLGVRLKKHPRTSDILFGLLCTLWQLRKRKTAGLAELSGMSDPAIVSVLRVFSCTTLAAFYARPHLLPLIIFTSIRLSLQFGNTDASAFAYAGYGFLLCGLMQRFEAGHQFGLLALRLLRENNFRSVEARTIATVHGFISHWQQHLLESCPSLLQGHRIGRETGDHQFAATCAATYCSFSFYGGVDLQFLYRQMNTLRDDLKHLNQSVPVDDLNMFRQVVFNLTTWNAEPWALRGPIYDRETCSDTMEAAGNYFGLFTQDYLSLLLCVLFHKSQESIRFADAASRRSDAAMALPESYGLLFYDSIARLSVLSSCSWRRRHRYLHTVRRNLRKLKKWSAVVPENIVHKYELVKGLLCAHHLQHRQAADYFSRGIQHARENNYLHEQALGLELAGRYYLAGNDEHTASRYISQAHELYMQWGAVAKTAAMEQMYPPFVFADTASVYPRAFFGKEREEALVTGGDLHDVLEAARAIARETRFSRIMEKLIQLVLKKTQATRALLFLYEEQQLYLQALAETKNDYVEIMQQRSLDQLQLSLPTSVIHFVTRARQTVILENSIQSTIFAADPYIRGNPWISVLCMPIFRKNTCAGILYLEKTAAHTGFHKGQLKILDILLGQAIVSIENSKLYASLHKEKGLASAANRQIDVHRRLLQNMSAELAMVEEQERKSIADDLHDSVTQTLALSVIQLKKHIQSLSSQKQQSLHLVLAQTEEAVKQIRSLTFQLSPKILYDFGLVPALEWLVDDMKSSHSMDVTLRNELPLHSSLDNLTENANITLYRAVRELLINVCKHADTRKAVIWMTCDTSEVVFTVADEGKGFNSFLDTESSGGGYGLVRLQERIQALGGDVTIDTAPYSGSRVSLSLPLKSNQKET